MIDQLREKVQRLKEREGLLLYRWVAGRSRMAGEFIPLADLRLVSVSVSRGELYWSMAAPILTMERGDPVVRLFDEGVVTALDGRRKGVNLLQRMAGADERVKPATRCGHGRVGEGKDPAQVRRLLRDLQTHGVMPVTGIAMPSLFRISRNPRKFRPRLTGSMLLLLDVGVFQKQQEVYDAFLRALPLLGADTEDGWVLPAEYIRAGGCMVAGSLGITARSGSALYTTPEYMFRRDALERKWTLATAGGCDIEDCDLWDEEEEI